VALATPPISVARRRLLIASSSALALPGLVGCGSPLPLTGRPAATGDGMRRLEDSAQAHGLAAYRTLTDINVAYDGQWRPLVDRIQPEVVDAGYRGPSEERLMPRLGIVAQAYRGPRGHKYVWWRRGDGTPQRPGDVAVWFDGQRIADRGRLSAAALVAEGYGLFLLGPLWLAGRGLAAELDGVERVDGRACDVVNVWMRPGLGQVELDRATVFIDRDDDVMRRVRFTLEGYEGTQGAVAQVDTFEHRRLDGVLWPMRSHEDIVHPLRLPAHDWHVTGIDVNRGYPPEAVAGPVFAGAAAAPARPV
jgi:hypothetical protein